MYIANDSNNIIISYHLGSFNKFTIKLIENLKLNNKISKGHTYVVVRMQL